MIKYVVQISFLFAPALAISQCHHNAKRVDLGTVENFPMRNGKVYYIDPGCSAYGCRMPGVEIESNSDSVFSNFTGEVSAVFDLGDYECIVIKRDTNTFYSITKLSSVIVKKGQSITIGTFLGKSKLYKDKRLYSIIYMILDKRGRYFSEEKIWELFEQSNQSECKKDEIAYQLNQNNQVNHGSDNVQ